jgi:hypothetical protein
MSHFETEQLSIQRRLNRFVADAEMCAAKAAPGPRRDELLRKVQQAKVARGAHEWLSSSHLRAPTR